MRHFVAVAPAATAALPQRLPLSLYRLVWQRPAGHAAAQLLFSTQCCAAPGLTHAAGSSVGAREAALQFQAQSVSLVRLAQAALLLALLLMRLAPPLLL